MNKELQDYINKAKKTGLLDDQIRQNLINSGWPKDIIDETIKDKRRTSVNTVQDDRKNNTVLAKNNKRKILIISFIALFVVVLIGGCFYIWQLSTQKTSLNSNLDQGEAQKTADEFFVKAEKCQELSDRCLQQQIQYYRDPTINLSEECQCEASLPLYWQKGQEMNYCFCRSLTSSLYLSKLEDSYIPRDVNIVKIQLGNEPPKNAFQNPGPDIIIEYEDGILLRYDAIAIPDLKDSDFCEMKTTPLDNTGISGKTKNYLACWKYYNTISTRGSMTLNFYAPEIDHDYFVEEAKSLLNKINMGNYQYIGNFDRPSIVDEEPRATYVVIDDTIPPQLLKYLKPEHGQLIVDINTDISTCKEMNVISTRNECYYGIAMALLDESMCQFIGSDYLMQRLCFKNVALFKSDISLCDRVEVTEVNDLHKECLKEVAIKEKYKDTTVNNPDIHQGGDTIRTNQMKIIINAINMSEYEHYRVVCRDNPNQEVPYGQTCLGSDSQCCDLREAFDNDNYFTGDRNDPDSDSSPGKSGFMIIKEKDGDRDFYCVSNHFSQDYDFLLVCQYSTTYRD